MTQPRASAGALIVVAPRVATVARIANGFFMRSSSSLVRAINAKISRWLQISGRHEAEPHGESNRDRRVWNPIATSTLLISSAATSEKR
jgi:hypothetical protein